MSLMHSIAYSCCPAYSTSPIAVGVFPFKTVVSGRKLSMGYVEVATREGCPLFPAGARVRGQVHHHSEIVQVRNGGLRQLHAGRFRCCNLLLWLQTAAGWLQPHGCQQLSHGRSHQLTHCSVL